uniref:ATP synthase F0 subunit 8 n=1 Tax=Distenia punctulatoides TaxID=2980435 RepID=UPI0021D52593|nr:ATP synthase F0 subunit 8 [Distenia punctulatoides]UXG19093.1 ATP synthase F0 subunit 8 [Distenia punctulatoides]
MPQMAPLNWLSLFLLFIMIFILFNIWNFFSFKYIPTKTSLESKTLKFNWKW